MQIEIMLFVKKGEKLFALLTREGDHRLKSSFDEVMSEGYYQPTVRGEGDDLSGNTFVQIFVSEFGKDIFPDIFPVIHEMIHLPQSATAPNKERFIGIISESLLQKIRLPYYHGGLHLVCQKEVLDIVEIPTKASFNILNRIPVAAGNGWKDFVSEGFEKFSPTPALA